MLRHSITLITALALSGCVAEEPDLAVSEAFAFNQDLPAPGDPQSCHDFGCGKNTASVGPTKIHELHHARKLSGPYSEPNAEGVSIQAARDKFGTPILLVVVGAKLYGKQLKWPYKVLHGNGLEDAVIELHDKSLGLSSEVIVQAVDEIETWVEPIEEIETYYFKYRMKGEATYRDLCKAVDFVGEEWQLAADRGGNLHVAVVFTGDRYNRLTKKVTATGKDTEGWFNIGCAGTALPKMVLNRLADATSDAEHQSSPIERTTALRALTATYCPQSGLSYTIDGEPLGYTNAPDWMDLDVTDLASIEAVWKDGEVVCLTEPRREAEGDDVLDKVEDDCGLPQPCSEVPLQWWTVGYFLTGNP